MSLSISGIMQGLSGMSAKDVYGEKPIIPEYPTASGITADTSKAILDNFGPASDATAKINEANQEQLTTLLRKTIPGYDQIISKSSQNIQDNLAGKLPGDVQSSIERSDAAKAVGGGFSGSGVASALTLRDLGLTSLNRMDKGLSQAESWLAASRNLSTAAPLNVTSMFLNPGQNAELAQGQFQRNLFANQVAAAPNPQVRGQWDSDMSIIGMVLSAYGGGAGYTGAYKGVNGGGAGGAPGAPAGSPAGTGWDYNYGGSSNGSWNNTPNQVPDYNSGGGGGTMAAFV